MSRPRLSVVVAASDSPQAVAGCLASLGDAGTSRFELLVAADRERIPRPEPAPRGVLWVEALPGEGVHRLRTRAMARASGEVVAFTEDSCRLGPDWVDAWLAAFENPEIVAATGPVEHATGGSILDWAVFFCEYAPFLRSSRRQITSTRLAGNNFAARRESLERVLGSGDVHESLLAEAVQRSGFRIALVEGAVATHVRRFTLRSALRDRLRFGFEFGRLRACTEPTSRRVAAALLGPLILLLQLGRLALTLARKQRHLGLLVESFPITASLLTAWSVGEWLGWTTAPRRSSVPACRQCETVVRRVWRSPVPAKSEPGSCTSYPEIA